MSDSSSADTGGADLHYTERLHPSYSQRFSVDRLLYQQDTGQQQLIVFENRRFGRVLALDGIIQTTEYDEFIYHEMLAHVPLLAHPQPHRVLIIGGGDGGLLREVLKHRAVEQVTQVEIDHSVIEFCRRYLPNHSQGAFDDPRLTLVIDDGLHFVQSAAQPHSFDVIISDSTDPVGPGEALFSSDFYAGCQRCLRDGGILATQNGVAFLQLDEVSTTTQRLRPLFNDVHFFSAAVPTYVGGVMCFAWASNDQALRQTPTDELRRRFDAAGFDTRYYTPELHHGSFALPRYILDAMGAT